MRPPVTCAAAVYMILSLIPGTLPVGEKIPARTACRVASPVMTITHLPEFETTFGGEIVRPGDAAYDDLRMVFNGMVDRRPALFARCRTTADVQAAVNH